MVPRVHLVLLVVKLLSLSSSSDCKNDLRGFPPFSPLEVEGASIWKCRCQAMKDVDVQNLSSHSGTEILHKHDEWITILSSSLHGDALRTLNLHPCYQVTNISQLVDVEREQNFNLRQGSKFLHWNGMGTGTGSERVVRSATEDRDVNSGSLLYNFDHYKNYSALVSWYEALAEQHPSLVKLSSIGESYYHRDILSLRFSTPYNPRRDATHNDGGGAGSKPIVYVQCLLHAREWITGPVCMYIARQLTGNSQWILDEVEVVMVPIANPDGYYLTWYDYPKYRLWRKNLEPLSGTDCAGVDLNRNFNTHWKHNEDVYATSKCSSVHRGSAPGSSHEVQAITKFIEGLGQRAVGFLDVHSYHQKILYPPAWQDSNPDDIAILQSVATAVAGAMGRVGVAYIPKRMVDIYSASGTFPDWLIDYRKSPGSCQQLIPLTVELRPSAEAVESFKSGFLLPTQEIMDACKETFAGFKEFVKQTLNTGRSCLQRAKE